MKEKRKTRGHKKEAITLVKQQSSCRNQDLRKSMKKLQHSTRRNLKKPTALMKRQNATTNIIVLLFEVEGSRNAEFARNRRECIKAVTDRDWAMVFWSLYPSKIRSTDSCSKTTG